jgi:hypothetical protein
MVEQGKTPWRVPGLPGPPSEVSIVK